MEPWKKLSELPIEGLDRGTLIAFSASYPFEERVVMMLSEHRMGSESFDLLTITGYKAGVNPYVVLPDECLLSSDVRLVSVEWLVTNWTRWVWPEGDPNNVWVRPSLDATEIWH